MAVPVRLGAGVDAEMLLADIAGIGARADLFVDLNDQVRPSNGESGRRRSRLPSSLVWSHWRGPRTRPDPDAPERCRRSRSADAHRSRHERPWAVGVAMLPAGFVAVVAAVAAGVTALWASLLTPIGLAREIEPDPGLSIDAAVFSVGIVSTVSFVIVITAVAAWRRSRKRSAGKVAPYRRPAPVAGGMASAGFPPTVVSGVQMALNRGSGRGVVPVGTSVAAIVVAIFTIVSSLTFGAGLSHLLDTPRLTGINWDLLFIYPTAIDTDGDNVPIERIESKQRSPTIPESSRSRPERCILPSRRAGRCRWVRSAARRR